MGSWSMWFANLDIFLAVLVENHGLEEIGLENVCYLPLEARILKLGGAIART